MHQNEKTLRDTLDALIAGHKHGVSDERLKQLQGELEEALAAFLQTERTVLNQGPGLNDPNSGIGP